MSKRDDLNAVRKQLAPLLGKFSASSFRIYGLMPVRPGDTTVGLKDAKLDGERLDLVFEVMSVGAPDMTVSLWKPQGLTVKKDSFAVRKAARVTFARVLDVKVEGDKLQIEADGEQRTAPADGLALEVY